MEQLIMYMVIHKASHLCHKCITPSVVAGKHVCVECTVMASGSNLCLNLAKYMYLVLTVTYCDTDANYINYLHDWVMTSDNGFSKEPPFWDARMRWLRKIYIDAKKKFHEDGGKATTLEELGFHFDAHADAS